ncbi:MAG: amidohydrolase family protein [Actinomycetota bacterium]
MRSDLIIRGGTIVDGTGSVPFVGDVRIVGDRIADIVSHADGGIDDSAHRVLDAEGRVVTPGFIDAHSHLDVHLEWDPQATPSSWHGVTSVVIGNCGLSLGPCRPADRPALAARIAETTGIPETTTLSAPSWDWETYDDYAAALERRSLVVNTGGLVGEATLRLHAMGERAGSGASPTDDDLTAIGALVDAALAAGALGISIDRRHTEAGGHTSAELDTVADALARRRTGVIAATPRPDGVSWSDELTALAALARRSGRPTSFELTSSDHEPDAHRDVLDLVRAHHRGGVELRPQTLARPTGVLYGLDTSTPFDAAPAWLGLGAERNGRRLQMLRDSTYRQTLIAEADVHGTSVDLDRLFVMLPDDDARYDNDPHGSLAAIAEARGVSPAAAFIELILESDGHVVAHAPHRNRDLTAIAELLDDPAVVLGLADAGAHQRQITDASQPTFLLAYWVHERHRWTIEEAVRRLTSDAADLFGLADRGRLYTGAFADINVIDVPSLTLPIPEFVRDLPDGTGRYVQRAMGYDATIINGAVVAERGELTGELPGRHLRSG